MKKIFYYFLILVLVTGTLLTTGCSSRQSEEPQISESVETEASEVEEVVENDLQRFKGQDLNLYVAAGMKIPMDEVISAFQKESGVIVKVNYGPSGGLYTQIQQNQPCDLYYSADWLYIEKIEEIGKLEESQKFLKDNLVLVVSSGGKDKVKSMQDLTKEDVSIVIADVQAPVGVYSENALNSLELMDKLGDNIKARPSTVNQVAIMVKENQVDAGLVLSTVASGNELEIVEVIDDKHTGEMIFGTAIIKGGNTELAKAFRDFANENVEIFEKYGWIKL